MTTYQEILKLEIQKKKEETRILTGMLAAAGPAGLAPGAIAAQQHRGSGKYPNKSSPHYVKRENADEAFRKMPVAFTTWEYCHMLRDLLHVVVTSGCAYNWLRNFKAEGLVDQGPKLGNFSARTWTKTEKGLTPRWHDRTQLESV